MNTNRRFFGLIFYAWGIASLAVHLTSEEFEWALFLFSVVIISVGASLLTPKKKDKETG